METTLGISLYSYFYLKLAKMLFFLLFTCPLFNKFVEQEGGTDFDQKYGAQGGPSNVYSCK
jgi:hypothetical protein